MPTYDYQCRTCGVITEVVHSMLEDGPAACDSCGGELRRLVSPSGIIFKGSGFYKTDSRSSSGSATGGTQPSSTAGDGAAAPASADGGSKAGKTTPTTPSGGGAGSGESGRSSGSGAAASD